MTKAESARSLAVIGGGILGVAIARRVSEVHPELSVTIIEKETQLATHQSGRNSGVVHAGIYYAPGSLKAELCQRGRLLLEEFCIERGLPYVRSGKLVVARNDAEAQRLGDLYERATVNGVKGARLLRAPEISKVEPHVVGVAALYSPETAIVDFSSITRELANDIEERGGTVLLGQAVRSLSQRNSSVVIGGDGFEEVFDNVVVCAGLHADRLAIEAGADRDPQIVPFRGEYYVLREERRHLVKGLIYPVPDPRYPFLGVHLTPRFDGEVLVGPNAVLAMAREGYRRRDINVSDVTEILRWRGFRRFARKNWRTGLLEFMRSGSKRAFTRLARRYVPELRPSDLRKGPAGVRAQAMGADGRLIDDFSISRQGRVIVLRNAPSPGATSSLAIAEHVVDNYL